MHLPPADNFVELLTFCQWEACPKLRADAVPELKQESAEKKAACGSELEAEECAKKSAKASWDLQE
jgi:hypothetical protein